MSSIEKMVERITGDPPMEIFEDQGWFSITVESKEAERKLLAAKGKKVTGGHIIKILPSRYKMRPHEIFDWLLDTARVEERTGNLHFQSVIVPRNRSPVRVVDAQKEDKKDEKNSPQSRPPTPPKVQFSEQKKSESPNGENNKGVKGKGKWGWQPQPKGGGKGKGKSTGGRGFPNNSGTNSQNIQSNQNYNPPSQNWSYPPKNFNGPSQSNFHPQPYYTPTQQKYQTFEPFASQLPYAQNPYQQPTGKYLPMNAQHLSSPFHAHGWGKGKGGKGKGQGFQNFSSQPPFRHYNQQSSSPSNFYTSGENFGKGK
jgi:hypothetical protein